MSTMESIMQAKYESRKHLIKRLFSDIVCNEIEQAYNKTVLNPVPVGAENIDMEGLRNSSLMIILYVNRRGENEFDAMFTLDLAKEDTPLLDTIAGNTFMESKLQHMLADDANTSDSFGGPKALDANGTYALKKVSEYLETNDLETHCVYKFPDEVDDAIYKMAYTN